MSKDSFTQDDLATITFFMLDEVINLVLGEPSVLVVGAGNGKVLFPIIRAFPISQVTATEELDSELQLAERLYKDKPEVTILKGDKEFRALQRIGKKFDFVIAVLPNINTEKERLSLLKDSLHKKGLIALIREKGDTNDLISSKISSREFPNGLSYTLGYA